MATRRATKTYADDAAFINDFEETLIKDTITLDPSCFRGELADNVKVDLKFADKSRIGPIEGQVVFRGDNGIVALRLLDVPSTVRERYERLQAAVKAERAALMDSVLKAGEVILTEEHNRIVSGLQAEIDALRKQLSVLEQKFSQLEDQPTLSARGFKLPKYKGQEPIVRGTMAQWTGFLVQIQSNQRTGLIVLNVDGIERFALVKEGNIVAWRSDPMVEEETLGQLLLRSEQIESSQLTESLDRMHQTGQRLGQILQSMEIMTESQVYAAIHSQLTYVFQKVLSIRSGEFAFYAFSSLPEMYPWQAIQPVSLLVDRLRGASQSMEAQRLLNSLRGVQAQHIAPSPMLRQVASTVEWQGNEENWLTDVQSGKHSVGQLLQKAGSQNVALARMLWSLMQLQLIQFVQSNKKKSPIAERLQDKLKAIEGGTHFDVLEVHWISTKAEIEAKYQFLMGELNVQGDPSVPSALQSKIPEVLGGVYKAYSSILDDTARRSYRAEIIEEHHIIQAAVLLGQQAEQAIAKGDKRAAIQCYSKAIELQPNEVKWKQGLRHATMR